jgi:hypothetical protein
MSKYEEVKMAIMSMDGVSDVHYDYSSKTNCYCLHFKKDDRSFYLLSSSYYGNHLYCNYLSEDYWVIDYSYYTIKDLIIILDKLFTLLPQYDTDIMIDEMEAFSDAIKLDYKYADDDDLFEKFGSILANKYIESHKYENDEYNVLYTVIEHVCINAVIGIRPEKRRKDERDRKERRRLKREWKDRVKQRNKHRRK